MDTPHPDTAQLVPALEQALDHLPSAVIPTLIGDLERLQALLAARLLREAWQAAPGARASSSLEDLHHLTPAQVAELLNLTEPYVHELCRTGRVQATKSGKYWMIPVAGLRQWLVYPKRDIDDGGDPPTVAKSAGRRWPGLSPKLGWAAAIAEADHNLMWSPVQRVAALRADHAVTPCGEVEIEWQGDGASMARGVMA